MKESTEKQWYVVNTYVGHENKVKANLERRTESMNQQDNIFRIIVAEYDEPVLKNGAETGRVRKKNTYAGYLFIEMIMTDEAWFVVRNTPGVTGFIGSSGKGAKPFPVSPEEIEPVLKRLGVVQKDMYNRYKIGDKVKVLQGPLKDCEGVIVSLDEQVNSAKVSTIFFGRETILDIDFVDIDKK